MFLKKKGFTLIEMMIVIAVFSIGVLAVLRMVLHNMSAMDSIQTRTTASFLAKESLEIVYNMRDSNRLAGLPWDCVVNTNYQETDIDLDKVCSEYLLSGAVKNFVWQLGLEPSGHLFVSKKDAANDYHQNFMNNLLYLLSGNQISGVLYSYDHRGVPTIFSRYVVITGIVENGLVLPIDRVAKVESHVLFTKGFSTGEVVLESFIGNY